MPDNPVLCQRLRDRILASPDQRIPFADYMAMVLYAPEVGYYSRSGGVGPQGDFTTSVHLGHDFGELLAVQFADMWTILGQPEPFDLVEMGAGQGLLAKDCLTYLQQHFPDCCGAVRYRLVERSEGMRSQQQATLTALQTLGIDLDWVELEALNADSLNGCLFSNELVDALPVHLVIKTAEGLQEQYVTLAPDSSASPFALTPGDLSTLRILDYLQQSGVDLMSAAYPVGYQTEVHLQALDWLAQVARCLHRGYVLTIDYGYLASRYYTPFRREGTLQAYYRHAHHNDPLIHVGEQDLTAHVNFTALEHQGQHCGLHTLGFTQQALFLMALGLGDRLSELATITATHSPAVAAAIHRRDLLHRLIDPMGLGNFGVLIQGKGLSAMENQQPLKGLSLPI